MKTKLLSLSLLPFFLGVQISLGTGGFFDITTNPAGFIELPEGGAAFVVININKSNPADPNPSFAFIDWGDGTIVNLSLNEPNPGQYASFGGHVYAQDGSYSITIQVDADSLPLTAFVFDEPPLVLPLNDVIMDADGGVTIPSAAFFDPGLQDNFNFQILWGDGPPENIPFNPLGQQGGPLTHTYPTLEQRTAIVNVFEFGAGAGHSAQFRVFPPLRLTNVDTAGTFNFDWQGGRPPYDIFASPTLQSSSFSHVLRTPDPFASFPAGLNKEFFRVVSDPTLPPLTIDTQINLIQNPAGPGTIIDTTIEVRNTLTNQLVDPPSISAFAGIAQDDPQNIPLISGGTGIFTGSISTDLAGSATVSVEIVELKLVSVEPFHIDADPVFNLDHVKDDWAFPDGQDEFTILVSADDVTGNPVGPLLSNFTVIVDPLVQHTLDYNECGQAVFSFTSTVPGRYPVSITENNSGITINDQVRFPVVAAEPLDAPQGLDPGENTPIVVPYSFYIPPGWGFSTATLSFLVDAEMTTIAGFTGATDPDLTDGIDITGVNFLPIGGGDFEVQVDVLRQPTSTATRATIDLGFDTSLGSGAATPTTGVVQISNLVSDATNPLFGSSSVPINDSFASGWECDCLQKAFKVGCIIYIRTPPPAGMAQPTDKEICDAHNAVNKIFFKACIYFDKTIAPFSLIGPEFDGPMDADAQARVRRRMLAALKDAGIDVGCCFVVAIVHQDLVGSKANTVAGNGPVGGTILIENGFFGNGRSLAHECGHACENDPNTNDHAHPHGAGNLMTPTDRGATGNDISTTDPDGPGPMESQSEMFRSNPRFKDKTRTFYIWKIPDNLA